MAAAGFGKARDQRFGLGAQEQDLDVVSFIFQASDVGWQTGEGIGAARIHGDGKGVAMIL